MAKILHESGNHLQLLGENFPRHARKHLARQEIYETYLLAMIAREIANADTSGRLRCAYMHRLGWYR